MILARLRAREAAPSRVGRPADLLVVGLGNPSSEYEHSRHNVGADAVARCCRRAGIELRAERGTSARVATTPGETPLVAFAVPTTFMNDSGLAVAALCRRFSVLDLARLVVVHDELDLEPGVVRVKVGGGTAGHNGLRSIEAHVHSLGFVRVRIGIGKPPGRSSGASYVLRRTTGRLREELEVAAERAADAVELLVARGADAAMTAVNAR